MEGGILMTRYSQLFFRRSFLRISAGAGGDFLQQVQKDFLLNFRIFPKQ